MTSFVNSTEQATKSVNDLLSSLLPGATKLKINSNNIRSESTKGSKAKLIDRNLKKNIEIKERDVYKIKKKKKLIEQKEFKINKVKELKLEQNAKLSILKKHKSEGTLTKKEKKYLRAVSDQNINKAKSWDFDEDEKEELQNVQNEIMNFMKSNNNYDKHKRRRSKKKQFKEEISAKKQLNVDHRYPGLTPGLAPVGLSDEEDSSEEEKGF
ncbi:hypothetical protein TPHA_0F01350 [Tetrapisispora phaffii CBS 4417]|uniref:Regulator of rDNA transcription 14 n=1 Tax=Tetrapisispora phaffii (strain ATCC 24235 / CBS 4417 / NBRC 1672 / NRRL Y-8282 / UCD 70-5) TaxID=1071381 RepID=G8BV38_TETPH|nr:hypothetical protein TPHA_0F01350 [Tetrapisispora phaffii CBS 4417]CCE63620.1 hypothetical protein TPHA_0F01350 [Tetrapisispora phaffii CBS 4417]